MEDGAKMKILSWYTVSHFIRTLLLLTAIFFGIILLFDTIEILRRSSKLISVPFTTVIQMALLKLPATGQEVLPFTILFSTIMCFWSLTKKHELIIYRSSGLSAWQFILPVSLAGFAFGLVYLVVFNPISAVMTNKYERMESRYLGTEQKLVSISRNGLWLKQDQRNPVTGEQQNIIFHTQNIDLKNWRMDGITVLYTSNTHRFQKRIDAQSAVLKDGYWEIYEAYINTPTQRSVYQEAYKLKTNLTKKEIIESFSDPRTISFWSLPDYIRLMENSGISSRAVRMHYYTLMIQPLFFAAIVILAASLCLRTSRMENGLQLLVLTVFTAFLLFFVSNLLRALGTSEQLPVVLAAWAPSILTFLIAVNIIAITEDG